MAVFIQSDTLIAIPAFLILLFFLRLFLRYRKLSHVPGPFLASLTDFWRAYHQNTKNFVAYSLKLHAKYGPVVRVGPNTVHVSDATLIPIIFTNHGEFIKADSYHPMRVPIALGHSVGSVIDLQDESQATALKRGVGSAFTVKAILAYERAIDDTAQELLDVIRTHPTFNLFQTMQLFQLDVLTKIAFSRSFGHLADRRDVWGMVGPTRARLVHWRRWQALSTLEYYLYRHPFWCRVLKTPKSSLWVVEALAQLNARLKTSTGENSGKDDDDDDAADTPKTDLLQAYVDAGRKHHPAIRPSTLALMTTSTISAGFDTTAHTLTTTLYQLITHPHVMQKLRAELDAALPPSVAADTDTDNDKDDGSASGGAKVGIPQWEAVNKLPYLDAVLKEAMRTASLLPHLERVVPAAGVELCCAGRKSVYRLPPGTVVGAQPTVVHRDGNVFGGDGGVFRPERWVEGSAEGRVAMERGSLGFGSGKRVCLGRHVAELEVKKVVAVLVWGFEMGLVGGGGEEAKGKAKGETEGVVMGAGRADPYGSAVVVRFEERIMAGRG